MPRYNITEQSQGVDFGIYEGEDADAAVEALARDSGYESYRAMCSITDPEDLDEEVARQRAALIVREVVN